jgi:tRNA A37 N6-isopentenylltransferase MiaA
LAVPSYMVGLYRSRAELYRRIEDRVAGMISQGLVEEVRSLIERGYSQDLKALSTVGYQEILAHLTGRIGLDEAVRLVIRNTRQYARRQMTWFVRQEEVLWIPADGEKELFQIIKGLRQGRRPGDERVKRQREQMRRVWAVKTSTGLKRSA